MHKLHTWADVAKTTGHSDPWGWDPRILCGTSAAHLKAGYRFRDGYLSAVRQELVLDYGSLPGAFDIHFRRVKRGAARRRGPPQASALPFLRFAEFSDWSRPGRVTHGGYSYFSSRTDEFGGLKER